MTDYLQQKNDVLVRLAISFQYWLVALKRAIFIQDTIYKLNEEYYCHNIQITSFLTSILQYQFSHCTILLPLENLHLKSMVQHQHEYQQAISTKFHLNASQFVANPHFYQSSKNNNICCFVTWFNVRTNLQRLPSSMRVLKQL